VVVSQISFFEYPKDWLKRVGAVVVDILAFPLTRHTTYTSACCYRTSHGEGFFSLFCLRIRSDRHLSISADSIWMCALTRIITTSLDASDVIPQPPLALVSGWMGGHRQMDKPSQYVTSHPGQLSLAIPLWVAAASTFEYQR